MYYSGFLEYEQRYVDVSMLANAVDSPLKQSLRESQGESVGGLERLDTQQAEAEHAFKRRQQLGDEAVGRRQTVFHDEHPIARQNLIIRRHRGVSGNVLPIDRHLVDRAGVARRGWREDEQLLASMAGAPG